MAPTNRLIEARRAELRAEANAGKRQGAKTATATSSIKRRAAPPKTRTKPKT
ncbi:MAG: hypothetical protein HYZ40_06810 [Rhodospirillales bacterium]|nr:hypothetical protein [Rhodospirillales bacterium]